MLKHHSLRDKVFNLKNLYAAFQHVKKNKGKAGLDRVSIKQFETDLEHNINAIHKELKTKIYEPSPVKRVYIPKNKNESRPLGIPTVRDRVIQQAFRQIIEPIFEKEFSEFSYGFRPGRSCHNAIKKVDEYGKSGYRYVLDADIKAFYDTIPHKLIMKQLCVKIADGWVLTSIENMLKAGIMENGCITYSDLGTPQGGVLSPLLANLVGDIIDKEFEAAGYKFVRYADDFIILTKTEEELQPALELVKEVVEKKLEMKLSPNKTELTNFRRGFKFLGYKFTGRYKRISDKSLGKIKDKIRSHTKRSQGVNLKAVIEKLNPLILGNVNYFRFADAVGIFIKLDQWIRMRLRCFKFSRKWRSDNKRFKNQRFDKLGLKSYVEEFKRRRVLV